MNESLTLPLFRMLAGIGMFLIGMRFLEDAVRNLAGRSFKLFLRRHTGNHLKAILGGIVVTALLQSGSVVNLMVLAFVGSGVLTLRRALAVMLGSNIGTTLDSWIVALAGFRFNIEFFAYPLLGLSGLLLASTARKTDWNYRAMLGFGIGALFVGLDLLKGGFSVIADQMDFSVYRDLPLVLFLLIGVFLTALIQSSYATMAIALGALHSGALTILPATAIVLGAELGTTVKLLIAATGGAAQQRRVAWANFIFNAFTISIAALAIRPIHSFIVVDMEIGDPLIGLVFFQSLINVAGALVFLPLLNPVSRFLERRVGEHDALSRYIREVPPASADLALDALEKEVIRFQMLVIGFFRNSFELPVVSSLVAIDVPVGGPRVSENYAKIKELHGEVTAYYLLMSRDQLNKEESIKADQLISSLRNGMYAAKSMHDSAADIRQLRESSNEDKYAAYKRARQEMDDFTAGVARLFDLPPAERFEQIVSSYQGLQTRYAVQITQLYHPALALRVNQVEISTLLNFNRELYSGFKAMVWAVKDLLLTGQEADYFSELPGFIR